MLKTVERIQDHYRPEKLGDMALTIVPRRTLIFILPSS